MKILLIQTSFIGDVIAATAVVEKLQLFYPGSKIDMLVRQGNETLLENHPILNNVLIWKKKQHKYANLLALALQIRKEKYELVINLHRFLSSGLLTVISGANDTRGFSKNPLSFLFKQCFPHIIGDGTTEYQRNQWLITDYTDDKPAKPKLYPSKEDYSYITKYQTLNTNNRSYVCIAPSSVWFTKQLPAAKWKELIARIPHHYTIFLLGAEEDKSYSEALISAAAHPHVVNLSGKLTLLQSAALMKGAAMNYVNDSAPMHLCSAMNAPVTVFYLSTTPRFGFVPVAEQAAIVETKEPLTCRPCGIHGYMQCPKGHFNCAHTIDMNAVVVPAAGTK